MYTKMYSDKPNDHRFLKVLILIWLITAVIISGLCVLSGRTEARSAIKLDMSNLLTTYFEQAELVSRIYANDARSLSSNNSIKNPLELNLQKQLRDYCNKILGENGDYKYLKHLFIIGDKGNIVYSNSKIFQESIPREMMKSSEYERYLIEDSIYKLYYYPITMYDKKRFGAIIFLYDFASDSQLMSDSIQKSVYKKYEFYGFTEQKFLFYTDNLIKKLLGDDIQVPAINEQSNKRLILQTKGNSTILVAKNILDTFDGKGGILAIGLTLNQYNDLVYNIIKEKLLLGCIFIIILMSASYAIYLAIGVRLDKEAKRNSQIQYLRMQKHDFSRHLQVIGGLIKSKDYNTAERYIDDFNDYIEAQNEERKLGNSALNTLVQQKRNLAEVNHIRFIVECNVYLVNTGIKVSDLCNILGNLLDNAFEASVKVEEELREVRLELDCDMNFLILRVSNVGFLEEKNVSTLFEYGFTTKVDRTEEHGMGLYIVSKILKKYGGTIEVFDKNGIIEFSLLIPLKL